MGHGSHISADLSIEVSPPSMRLRESSVAHYSGALTGLCDSVSGKEHVSTSWVQL